MPTINRLKRYPFLPLLLLCMTLIPLSGVTEDINAKSPKTSHQVPTLPEAVQIDLEKKQISDALKDQDCLTALEHIITLQEMQKNELSQDLTFHAGECYYHTGNYEMAISSLNDYLGQANKTDKNYNFALDFFLMAEKKLKAKQETEKARELKREQKKLEKMEKMEAQKLTLQENLKAIENEMVTVYPGCFYMGSLENDDEKPIHKVCITDAYAISKHEVTRQFWETVMGEDTLPDMREKCLSKNCPIKSVSWIMVQKFINKLNGITGRKYRLPSEAEWEYACRSGGKNQQPCYEPSLDSLKWYISDNQQRTYPVGQDTANDLGLFDMNINVGEWVQDYYDRNYYQLSSLQYNPQGPSHGTQRIVRGGCCYGYSSRRDNNRTPMLPDLKNPFTGFRLAEDFLEDNYWGE